MPLRLFAHRNRAGAYINILLVPATMFGVFFFLTQFLQNVLGMNPLVAGLAFLPMTLTMFTTVRLLPRLLPVIGAKPMAVASAALLVVGIIWLAQLSASSTYLTGILGPSLVLGLGMGSANLPLSVIVLSGVTRDDSGIASGALQTMQQVGASLGVAILVTIFGMASRTAAAHPALHASAAAQGRAMLVAGVQTAFRWDVLFPLAALAVAVIVIQGVRAARSHDAADDGDKPAEQERVLVVME
jgi:predicted MFS family arabinose efflux permease